jgi:hypothetical protein
MCHWVTPDNVNLFLRCGKWLPPAAALMGGLGSLLLLATFLRAAPPADATPSPTPNASGTPVSFPPTVTIPTTPGGAAESPTPQPEPKVKPSPAAQESPKPEQAHPVISGGPKFIGATSCSSSLCHGGGSEARDAFTIWNKSDPHKHSFADLAGPRAARIAQGLELAAGPGSTRCTVCHAPLWTVPEERLASTVDAKQEGVSCESCHGPAQNWLRSHTRRDFTHADNVETGVRDLNSLYVRANTCVACHQVLDPELLVAGHPPLIFELDAQTVAEPRHWVDRGDYFGPQAWLVGQSTALREASWSLSKSAEPPPEAREQWRALVWLIQRTTQAYGGDLPKFDVPDADDYSPGNVARAQKVGDELARAGAHLDWSRASTRRCLEALAATHKEFVPVAGGEATLALQCRAQRLVLALARLVAPLQAQDDAGWHNASMELDKLFQLADARAAFDGSAFSEQLQHFAGAFAPSGN